MKSKPSPKGEGEVLAQHSWVNDGTAVGKPINNPLFNHRSAVHNMLLIT